MHHGDKPRPGFVTCDRYNENYLIRCLREDYGMYEYLAVFKCCGDLVVSTVCLWPENIVCKGKVVNEDGSERQYMYVDASIRID